MCYFQPYFIAELQASISDIPVWSLACISHFFFFFLAAPRHMGFRGQGSDLSRSLHLSRSCSNIGSLTLCARVGIEPASQRSQDTADPTAPQWELLQLTVNIANPKLVSPIVYLSVMCWTIEILTVVSQCYLLKLRKLMIHSCKTSEEMVFFQCPLDKWGTI